MELLRNKGKLTRILILVAVAVSERRTVSSIAEAVGITPQGTSEHLADMENEGLVIRGRGRIRATVEGVEHLQSSLLTLKGFIDSTVANLEIVRSTDAIAETDIKKGEKVALSMKRGLLFASKGKGGSWGVADTDAAENDMVQVSSLSGVLEMERSAIRLVRVPPARSGGGSCRLDPARLIAHARDRGLAEDDLVLAALDMEGAAMLRRSALRCDLEMPDAETLAGYQERGRPVIAFGTPYSVAVIEERLSAARASGLSERDEGIEPV